MKVSKVIALLLGMLLCMPGWSASSKQKTISALDEVAAKWGLVRIEKKNVDLVYARPDASLAKYHKVRLMPIDVMFSKNFDPGADSVLYRMHPPDRERIKSTLAKIFADEFKSELQKGGYEVVDVDGNDVLEIRAAIVNLYISAPDVSMDVPGRVRTFTTDAGEMTLVMELHDSVTGTVLAQIFDRRAATSSTLSWSSSVTNTADASFTIRNWAKTLRKALDASRVE